MVADVERPGRPGTAFGYLVEGLDRRRHAGLAPFTVLSATTCRTTAPPRGPPSSGPRGWDPQLADWIEAEVAFPSSMVDRITPETTDDIRETVVRDLGLDDQWPVVTEPFSQWVVEDSFCKGRPPLEQVGVQFVPTVAPYEVMKTRMLNGAHCALGYLGHLAGYGTSDEAMADPLVRGVISGYLQEASALLLTVPGIDLEDYRRTLLERFSTPRISDQLARLCRRGSTKVPAYLLPSLRQALDQDQPATTSCSPSRAGCGSCAARTTRGCHRDRGRPGWPPPAAGRERWHRPAAAAVRAGRLRLPVQRRAPGQGAGARAAAAGAGVSSCRRGDRAGHPRCLGGQRGAPVSRDSRQDGAAAVRSGALDAVKVLLCDADGNPFPSEEPAFVASTKVPPTPSWRSTARTGGSPPRSCGWPRRGCNFRSTARAALCLDNGICVAPSSDPRGGP